jgi:TolB protein
MKKTMLFLGVLVLLWACFSGGPLPVDQQNVAVQFMKSTSIDVVEASCRITADDMDTIDVDLAVSPSLISGEIPNVPFGQDRLFEIFCYNSSGVMNYYGSALVDISDLAPVVDIVLYPVDPTATVTINGRFADTEETEDKIVFVADWDGDPDLYIMDSDGTNIRQLTNAVGNEDYPKLSMDRSKVLFHRGFGDGHPQAFIIDVETLEETHITPLDGYDVQCPSWHPSGNSIVFHSGYTGGHSNIYAYDFATETVTPLVEDSSTCWVPLYTDDGESLVYYSNITGVYKAYIANANGTNPVMIRPDSIGEQRRPNINPVDANIVAISGRGYTPTSYSQWGLFLIDRSDSSITNIISTNGVDEKGAIWSPDGTKILYERNYLGNHGLYLINPDGSENTVLLDTPDGNETRPHWR